MGGSQEPVLRRGRANFQRSLGSVEAAGGVLELTNASLTFRPHVVNVTVRSPVEIPLAEIASLEPVHQRVFGLIPSPLGNAFIVRGVGGTFAHVIVVWQRDAWLAAISDAMARARATTWT